MAKKSEKKKEEQFPYGETKNDFDLCKNLCCDVYNPNYIQLSDIKENKNEIENSSEFNYSPTDGDIEKDIEEISLVNIDNRKNLMFLQL